MPRNVINEETSIKDVILLKGHRAEEILNNTLCDGVKDCQYGTSLTLSTAAKLKGKSHLLSDLLTQLNHLPKLK